MLLFVPLPPGVAAVVVVGVLFVYSAIRSPAMVSKLCNVPAPVLIECSAFYDRDFV
jgi:hypothetical protein